MLVWGDASRFARARDGAAFDPAWRRWRRLAPAPVALNQATAARTGSEVIALGALLDENNRSRHASARALAYDPARDRWRRVAPFRLSPQASSIGWMGSELLAWDYELRAGTYDPLRDRWRRLPPVRGRFAECYPETARVGRRLLAWHCGEGALYDRARRSWSPALPAPRTAVGRPVGAGRTVLFPSAADYRPGPLWAYRPGSKSRSPR